MVSNMAMADLYGYCSAALGDSATADEKLECFSTQMASFVGANMTAATTAEATTGEFSRQQDPTVGFARDFLLLFAASLVFFMQAGFAMVCAGCVQKKNVGNSMLKNLLDACGSSVAFFCIGYAFAFGADTGSDKTFVGTSNFFLRGVDDYAFEVFQFTFSAASATIVAGTLAERCQMGAYLSYSLLLSGFVYPVVAHAVWSEQGFLSAFADDPLIGMGMVDFAGSGVVHATGGITALWATYMLGARRGRFYDPDTEEKLETPKEFPGHSIALQMLGTFILWFGWFGFNSGPALLSDSLEDAGYVASLAALNTSLSGGTAGIVALLVNYIYLTRTTGEGILDLRYAMNGSLTGLASITAGCGFVEPWAAIVTGAVAGILYNITSRALVHFCLDDAVEAIPVHMAGGAWGIIAAGCFASPTKLMLTYGHSDHAGWFYDGSDFTLIGTQLLGLLFIFGWATGIMLPFFNFLSVMGWFRSDPLEEIVGLDRSYHGGMYLIGNTKKKTSSDGEPDDEDLTAFEELKRSRHKNNSYHKDDIIIPPEVSGSAGADDEPGVNVEKTSRTTGDQDSA